VEAIAGADGITLLFSYIPDEVDSVSIGYSDGTFFECSANFDFESFETLKNTKKFIVPYVESGKRYDINIWFKGNGWFYDEYIDEWVNGTVELARISTTITATGGTPLPVYTLIYNEGIVSFEAAGNDPGIIGEEFQVDMIVGDFEIFTDEFMSDGVFDFSETIQNEELSGKRVLFWLTCNFNNNGVYWYFWLATLGPFMLP
jgi:hypothetical protein